jgi:hypothetical protein
MRRNYPGLEGLIADGVVYVRGCNTRYGAFPFAGTCDTACSR